MVSKKVEEEDWTSPGPDSKKVSLSLLCIIRGLVESLSLPPNSNKALGQGPSGGKNGKSESHSWFSQTVFSALTKQAQYLHGSHFSVNVTEDTMWSLDFHPT
jgi:hypothetical protein